MRWATNRETSFNLYTHLGSCNEHLFVLGDKTNRQVACASFQSPLKQLNWFAKQVKVKNGTRQFSQAPSIFVFVTLNPANWKGCIIIISGSSKGIRSSNIRVSSISAEAATATVTATVTATSTTTAVAVMTSEVAMKQQQQQH